MQTVVETPSYLADAERLFSPEERMAIVDRLPVFVLAVFAKNEKANLSPAERNTLAKMVADMIKRYRRQK
jgi:uncharacterized protein YciW